MKAQCKTCGKNCEGEYCFQHKPRKPLSSAKGFKVKVPEKHSTTEINPMKELFLRIWKTRPRKSEVSGDYLIGEVSTAFFHHILPKEKYRQVKKSPTTMAKSTGKNTLVLSIAGVQNA